MTDSADKPNKIQQLPTKVRAQRAIELTAQGHTQAEIAAELGINRSTVSQLINREDSKRIIKEGESRIFGLVHKSIDVLSIALGKYTDGTLSVSDLTNAVKSAQSILKSTGVIKEKLNVEHTAPKPFVVQKLDGSQVIMGTKEEEE